MHVFAHRRSRQDGDPARRTPWLRNVLGASLGVLTVVTAFGLDAAPAGATTPVSGATSVSSGRAHTCARTSDGRVLCWGTNDDGDLGTDTEDDVSTTAVYVQSPDGVGPLTDVVQVAAQDEGACAVLVTREVVCWGANDAGQRGIGTTAAQPPPPDYVRNPSGTGHLSGVRFVARSTGPTTCVVLMDGQARCWGRNVEGQLGTGSTSPQETLPVVVMATSGTGPLTGITAMDVGAGHACARLSTGQARCWGANSFGQLGDGTVVERHRPVAVRPPTGTGALTDVASIAAGQFHTCAVLTSGQARCWGRNASGQLGTGTTSPDRRRPTAVRNIAGTASLTGIASTSGGFDFTCARTRSGQARCWGADSFGEAGDGVRDGVRPLPAPVKAVDGAGPITGVRSLSAGDNHVCAVAAPDGRVLCWGNGSSGQRGDDTIQQDLPLPVMVVMA